MSRIKARFESLQNEGRGAFIPYIEAFDPDRDTSLALLRGMALAGADLIEVGVPFSDPAADGPTIQQAARRALKAGATLRGTLDMVQAFRQEDTTTPIVLMGYLNPIDRYGPERFCHDAAAAGVDGLIIVDLPPEEADMVLPHARAKELDLITLTAPNTPPERLKHILRDATGFVYFVSITGITGTGSGSREVLSGAMTRLRQATALPVVAGFGIATPEQARTAASVTNGAVVASALIKTLTSTLKNGNATVRSVPAVLEQVRSFAEAVRQQKHPTQNLPDTAP